MKPEQKPESDFYDDQLTALIEVAAEVQKLHAILELSQVFEGQELLDQLEALENPDITQLIEEPTEDPSV